MKRRDELHNCRRAVTLIEMMAVIALSSIVMGLVGVTLHSAWQIERAMDNHRLVLDSIGRLAQQFRDDVHAAQTVGTSPNSSAKKFTLNLSDEKQIEYQGAADAMQRLERDRDQIVRRESYTLPPEAAVDWQIESLGKRQQTSMIISYPLDAKPAEFSEQRELRIDALVGESPPEIRLSKEMP